MRTKIVKSIMLSISLAGCSTSFDATSSGDPQAAEVSRQVLRELASAHDHQFVGIPPADAAERADMSDPARVFMIRLDQLREYPAKGTAASLLTDLGMYIYPVRVDGQVRSSLTMRKADGQWRTAAVGGINRTRAMEEARAHIAIESKLPRSATFLVQVPALNVDLVGYYDKGELMLAATQDRPELRIQKQARPANEVLLSLAEAARIHNGQPT